MRQAGKTDIELVGELIWKMIEELPDATTDPTRRMRDGRLIDALQAVLHDAKYPDVVCNRVDNDWP